VTATPPPPSPWRPAPALVASAGLHAVGAAALALAPSSWPAVALGLAANHAVLAVAGLVPRSRLLGPNLTRLPAATAQRGEIALTFDDGPDPEVTPRVLDLLDAAGARATFFCVGTRAARHAALVRGIVARGHAVENHTERHSTAFGWYGPGRLRAEIGAAQRTLGTLTGRMPRYFRAPFGMRSPLLDPALAHLGLRLVSWTRRGYDTADADATSVLASLARGLAAGDILVLHDGVATGRRAARPTALDVLPGLLARARDAGLRAVTLREALDEP
jgi:peptidoglycan/xylan/chitin deacetylase (PgdA/CDA1 family)